MWQQHLKDIRVSIQTYTTAASELSGAQVKACSAHLCAVVAALRFGSFKYDALSANKIRARQMIVAILDLSEFNFFI